MGTMYLRQNHFYLKHEQNRENLKTIHVFVPMFPNFVYSVNATKHLFATSQLLKNQVSPIILMDHQTKYHSSTMKIIQSGILLIGKPIFCKPEMAH